MKKTKKSKYGERLANPRWQKKRLEIMQRAGFACEWCGTREVELQIHHGYYEKERRDPWCYAEESLYCLCDKCHEQAERARQAIYRKLGFMHPRHHWDLFRLLKELDELLQQDPEALVAAGLGYKKSSDEEEAA